MKLVAMAPLALWLLSSAPAAAEPPSAVTPSPEVKAAPASSGPKVETRQPGSTPPASSDIAAEKAIDAELRRKGQPAPSIAKQLEFLALLWKQVQATLEQARSEEAKADGLEQEVIDLDDQAKRALLLMEQTEARRARALARLKELEAKTKP